MRWGALVLSALVACGPTGDPAPGNPEDFWTDGEPIDVEEPLRFTETRYADVPASGPTMAEALDDVLPSEQLQYATGDGFARGVTCEGQETSDLPVEIEGIVTLHPRWYQKLSGCNRGEEKYYGNYFIQDASRGIFVVGDSRVAHFDMGDRVRLRVRAVRTNFDMDLVWAHDVIAIDREARPIYYEWANEGFDNDDIGEVRRIVGTVVAGPDTFGETRVETDEGVEIALNFDAQLNRRRQFPEVGERVCATGPVLYSFSEYSIVINRVGQFTVLEDGASCPD